MEDAQPLSPLFRITRDGLMLLAYACVGIGGGYLLKFALAHGGGKYTAMALVAFVVSVGGLVHTGKRMLRKQKRVEPGVPGDGPQSVAMPSLAPHAKINNTARGSTPEP